MSYYEKRMIRKIWCYPFLDLITPPPKKTNQGTYVLIHVTLIYCIVLYIICKCQKISMVYILFFKNVKTKIYIFFYLNEIFCDEFLYKTFYCYSCIIFFDIKYVLNSSTDKKQKPFVQIIKDVDFFQIISI